MLSLREGGGRYVGKLSDWYSLWIRQKWNLWSSKNYTIFGK